MGIKNHVLRKEKTPLLNIRPDLVKKLLRFRLSLIRQLQLGVFEALTFALDIFLFVKPDKCSVIA